MLSSPQGCTCSQSKFMTIKAGALWNEWMLQKRVPLLSEFADFFKGYRIKTVSLQKQNVIMHSLSH